MTTQAQIRTLSLNALVLSQSPIQVERRAQFDQEALKEMSVTIRANGRVEQAITVRAVLASKGQFEVADGERRVLATEMAGIEEILAEVRELTDEQVEEIQIVTGLQKEKLHELVEAEGYETLHKRGLTVDEIAAKCAKSTATVYARMKLLALCKEGREAVRSGKLSASVGLLVARIPIEKLQKEAVKHFERGAWDGAPFSYREASRYVQQNYMLRLEQAPFPVNDATLVKSAGACRSCPKNTTCQPELFADVSSGAMCTDQACFAEKKSAFVNRQVAEARAAGTTVIRGAEAKRIAPGGATWNMKDGWVKLDSLAKGSVAADAAIALLQVPGEQELVEIVKQKDVRKPKPATRSSSSPAPKEDGKHVFMKRYTRALFAAICGKVQRVERWTLEMVVTDLFGGGIAADLDKQYGLRGTSADHAVLQRMSDAKLQEVLLAVLIGYEFDGYKSTPATLLTIAKRYKVDPTKVRKDLEVADKAAAATAKQAAKASKKKAPKK